MRGMRVDDVAMARAATGMPPLAQADTEELIRGHGAAAFGEAREREHHVILPDDTTYAGRIGGPPIGEAGGYLLPFFIAD